MTEFDPQMLNKRYIVRPGLAIEDFGDEALVFLPDDRRLVKINSVARDILGLLDGERLVKDIVDELASAYAVSVGQLTRDVPAILFDLTEQAVIKEMTRLAGIKDFQDMENTKYCMNHDVSCRIEEPEGAILFNPETDAVQAVNPTGLIIWQALEKPRSKQEIVEYLLDVCEDVPTDQVANDVEAFIEQLKSAGFIGEVVE